MTIVRLEPIIVPRETLVCTGCARPFEAPTGSKDVECSHCGKAMHIVTIQPAGETGKAT